MKNAPMGFWVCKGCGSGNPLLVKECPVCGKIHGEFGKRKRAGKVKKKTSRV